MPVLQSTDCGCRMTRTDAVYHHLREADAPLAMGYVPFQPWECPFELCQGLQYGTIFPGLHKPFCGKGGRCR